MGLEIKQNKIGNFKVKSGETNEDYFDGKYVPKEDVKKMLIQKEIWRFLEKIIEIEMNFPFHYTINDKRCIEKPIVPFNQWFLDILDKENDEQSKLIYEKVIEIILKYNLYEYFEPLINNENNDK